LINCFFIARGNSRIDIVRDQIRDDVGESTQARRKYLHREKCSGWAGCDEAPKCLLRDNESCALLASKRVDHAPAAECHLRQTQYLPGQTEPEDYVPSYARNLLDFDASGFENIDICGGVVGAEHVLAFDISAAMAKYGKRLPFLGGKMA
jgi:hypothetical protein